jgi:hypothetical protein
MIGLIFMMCGLMVRMTIWGVRLTIMATIWTAQLMAVLFVSSVAMIKGMSGLSRR